jgi:hypothetical protein
MRDVPAMWAAWKSGGQVGELAPSTRVTVDKSWRLETTGPTVGTWTRGPAHWYQREDNSQQETEIPNVISVNSSRSLESDAGTCDIVVMNQLMPTYGDPETPPGQFGYPGALTFDHGVAQDARARWSHAVNSWQGVLVPNALIRTYQGYGGQDKTIHDAIADGNLILNGVWLVDDVQIGSDGNISLKCRDVMKFLIDQWLFPPLVPTNLFPPKYERYHMTPNKIPKELPPPWGNGCYPCNYFSSSTDLYYNEWNTHATGHPGTDAFDISTEERPAFAHQATFWLSEPFPDPSGTPWIEFLVQGGEPRPINQIYFHVFEGKLMGWPPEGIYRVMVSVIERGVWAAPDLPGGGVTPQGIPYVSSFVPATDWNGSNQYMLPRIYWGSLVRLTVTNLQPTWEGGWRPPAREIEPQMGDGGFRAGARKIMACLNIRPEDPNPSNISFTAAAIPANSDDRRGYWQVRSTGQIYAFGDARIQPCTSPRNAPKQSIVAMDVHPNGKGYWVLDDSGIVLSYGDAQWYGDLADWPYDHSIGIARTPSGNGYWILERDGAVHAYGDAPDHGRSNHSNTMVSGAPAMAEAICSHPTTPGYWVLWTDGFVDAHGVPHYGDAPQSGLYGFEFYTSIRPTDNGQGYWILRSLGGIEARGNAPFKGHSVRTNSAWAGAKWFYGVPWEIVNTSTPGNGGYLVHRADGTLEPIGEVNDGHRFGSIAEGVQFERSPGNYKDYSDIVRELLLWAGFYLKPVEQAANKFPNVYANIETTGAWADDPLPETMFEKRPVYDAIRDLRDIVGYIFYADTEGAIHWESPSWWGLGNWLTNVSTEDGQRVPYDTMPEIDESVQLQGHSISYSGQSAYSEIILATEDPMPREEGKPVGGNITQTRLVPKTAPDLRGMTHIYMRTHIELSKKLEQKIMADLIDMKMWFSRRLGEITCAANPLIDINDQVRVIERTTGEVYIHYVRGVTINHDLQTGDFTMTLSTHWLGGGPWEKFTLFYAGAARPQSDGYWTATIGGTIQNDMRSGVYPSGRAELYTKHEADSHTDDVIAMRSTPSGLGFYTMDRTGQILTYGDAVHRGQLYRPRDNSGQGEDVQGFALTPSGLGYWVILKDGTVTAFGDATFQGNADISGTIADGTANYATSIESHPAIAGYWTLTATGTVGAHGLPHYGNANPAAIGKSDKYVAIRHTSDGHGYWILASGGVVSNHGNAPHYGNGTPYPEDQFFYGLTWDLLAYEDNSYALLHADGSLEGFGAFTLYSPIVRYDTKYWALVPSARAAAMTDQTGIFPVSDDIISFLKKTGSPAAANAIASDFGTPPDAQRVST